LSFIAAIEPSPPLDEAVDVTDEEDDPVTASDVEELLPLLLLPHPARKALTIAAIVRTTSVFFQMFLLFMSVSSFFKCPAFTFRKKDYFPG
jgi:hypothetical protein